MFPPTTLKLSPGYLRACRDLSSSEDTYQNTSLLPEPGGDGLGGFFFHT